MIRPFVLSILLIFSGFHVFSGNPVRVCSMRQASEVVKVDGLLLESTWKEADVLGDFFQTFPFDTGRAKVKTEVRLSFDSKFLYVAATCFEDKEEQVVLSLRRDFALKTNDNFSVVFDPYLDGANGFNFGVTPLGTQREALILNGDQSFILWDNRWLSAVKRYPDRWVVEMAIPFTTLRYTPGLDNWKINFSRTDVSANEVSTWVRIPRTYPLTVLSLAGDLIWETPLKKAGTNISLIPYVSGGASRTKYPVTGPVNRTLGVGGDAKIAVTSSLNLDLTVNPDFSNVDVDRQVANLSRFEIFFPEQRQFFNENNDLFSQSGFSRIRPFFTRRIGLNPNPNAPGLFIPNRILYGARLSGKLNPTFRMGILNVQTANDRELGIDGTNFTVATFQQKIFGRSNLAGLLVNRQVLKDDSGRFSFRNNRFNRVLGLDYNLLSKDNRWTGKFFYHHSFANQKPTDAFAHAVYLNYNVPEFTLIWNHEAVGKGYNPETGYLQRPGGFFRIEPEASYRYYLPSISRFNFVSVNLYNDVYWDRHREVTDQLYQVTFSLVSKNTAAVSFGANRNYTRLYNGGFDPSNTNSVKLDSNRAFWYNALFFSALTDNRKVVSASGTLQAGQYFNGWLNSADAALAVRTGVWATWSVTANFRQFFFPEPYPDRSFWLVGPRAELSFSKSHFFTGFFQYNQQLKNININARYQWRFAPMSDLFVVYSENYLPQPWLTKNRALIMKLVYWLNV